MGARFTCTRKTGRVCTGPSCGGAGWPNFFAATAAALAISLAGCATVPADGEAVDCSACDTLWIRLLPASGAPGLYRLNHQDTRPSCPTCQKLAVNYFETGQMAGQCVRCGGKLTPRPVSVTR